MSVHILMVPALLGSTATIPPEPVPAYQTEAAATVAVHTTQLVDAIASEAEPEVTPTADPIATVVPVGEDTSADDATTLPADPAPDLDAPSSVLSNPSGDGPDETLPYDDNFIVVTGRASSPADPVEVINEVSYEAVQVVDDLVVAPITHTYMKVLPEPVQDGVHNFINNLDEPIVALNFLLQLKFGKALETLGRFAINSTVGVGGLFDVAKKKPFNLPRRSNGLADTLGYYGVGPGPYLFLPLIGSTTVRDLVARPFDLLLLPTAIGKPFTNPLVSGAKGTLSSLDDRREKDADFTRIRNESDDPYVTMRDEYLLRRQAEIDVLRGLRTSVDDPTPPVRKGQKPAVIDVETPSAETIPVAAIPADVDAALEPQAIPSITGAADTATASTEPSLLADAARGTPLSEVAPRPVPAEETPDI